ncbi:MAG: FecR domain-containing protein [Bacteroidota bacterium]|nr:FecR domain-containing protein [Bacteroidota bacterium]MDP4214047.1 FecR domain-containing protein [Bacteroidota bacterium]MDP4248931.1 FecR domain-containing protein [Bacteroidota bacterium]
MHNDEIWNLMAKKLSGEASPEDLSALEKALRLNPELHYSLQAMQDMWKSRPQPEKELAEKALQAHLERLRSLSIHLAPQAAGQPAEVFPESGRRHSRRKLLVFAALILLLIIPGVYFLKTNRSDAVQAGVRKSISEVVTRNGSKTNLLLPDGTTVWLNAGSRLTYDSSYGNDLREVTLSGEGYFDVVRNPQKPFIIHTGRINIRVLGTVFNVKSYPEEKTIETSLIRGSIEVSFSDSSSKKIILLPNQKLILKKEETEGNKPAGVTEKAPDAGLIKIDRLNPTGSDSSIAETAWIQNRLTFNDISFKDLAIEMERKYGVSISLMSEGLDTLHFTGSFQNEPVLKALDALRLTSEKSPGFTYRMEGDKVLVYNLSNDHSIQRK